MRLSGKRAVVTGASRGIGLAIARSFVREGAAVFICGRKPETIHAAAHAIGATPVVCHVGRPADIESLTAQAGAIDILVNNAATNIAQGPCLSFDDALFDKMVEINLKSSYRLIRAFAPGMCERGRGSIINISSIAGLKPQYESLLYSMTKAALIMMTRSYALELGPKGVRVNAIAPGLVRTSLSEFFWNDPKRLEKFLATQPIKHLGEPEEIAEAAVLLAGDESSYLTGQVVTIDGGYTLQ